MSEASRIGAAARRFVGGPVAALPTPALVVDLPTVRANIAEMARRMDTVPAALRPHAKIHKSPRFARMQLDAGAVGITTATIWEASAMVEDGLTDVLVANQVVGAAKEGELARLAGVATITVSVDDAANVERIAAAAHRAGNEVGVLVELDVGLHRAGVRSVPAAVALAELVERTPGVRLGGAFGYEGHCMLEPDREERIRKAKASNELLLSFVDALEAKGLEAGTVAAGGLGTWDITGANPRITEIHAGSYIFSDAFHRDLVPGFDPALTVLATITSRSGAMAVVDAGRKSIGIDRTPPELVGVAGRIRFEHGEHFIHEEHIALELEDDGLRVGDTVRLMPGYSPTTVNFYDCYFVAERDVVTDVWPILGRYGTESIGGGS
ncbi:MAG TPA: alanine racemase [Solirubrobacterales bacterium]|jgi:D-serine deaminase-like pyridoxal phosphate-dependent protein|nr:alanine racemase [Solirubrobacterales bacterium]